jgi:hypothetical protein
MTAVEMDLNGLGLGFCELSFGAIGKTRRHVALERNTSPSILRRDSLARFHRGGGKGGAFRDVHLAAGTEDRCA